MNIKDLAEMIGMVSAIMIISGSILWIFLDFKLRKIYDELKEIRKEKKEVKYGHWATVCDGLDMVDYHICSLCGHQTYEHYPNFCPNCGAVMRGKTE